MSVLISKKKAYLLAIRPKTILASIGPVIIGLSFAKYFTGKINTLVALLTILSAILLQISTNVANDYLDYKKGTDTKERIGPIRVTSLGLLSETEVKRLLIISLLLSFITGFYLMIHGGVVIVVIGLLSLYFAYGYTGGPFPLSYHGLGEFAAFIFFGLIAVYGTYYLQDKNLNSMLFIPSSAVGLISAAILGINNLRDIKTDKLAHKKTLAVRIGEHNQRFFILTCIILSSLSFIYLSFTIHHRFFYGFFLSFLFSSHWKRIYKGKIDKELNLTLASTAKYLFLYSVFIAVVLNSL